MELDTSSHLSLVSGVCDKTRELAQVVCLHCTYVPDSVVEKFWCPCDTLTHRSQVHKSTVVSVASVVVPARWRNLTCLTI